MKVRERLGQEMCRCGVADGQRRRVCRLAGGAVAVDRDGQAASSRTPIDRRAGCGCARWHALYWDAVGWAASFTEVGGNGGGAVSDTGGFRRIGQSSSSGRSWVVYCACVPLGTNGVAACDSEYLGRRRRPVGSGGVWCCGE